MAPENHDFPTHPMTLLRDWGNGQGFRLFDALTGVMVFGATGSGKTSGPGKHLAIGYLKSGFGGLVLCAKPEERRQWEEWAAETGRSRDLVIIEKEGPYCFNPLEWEASREGKGAGLTMNIVAMLDEIASVIERARAGRTAAGEAITNSGRTPYATCWRSSWSFPCSRASRCRCGCCARCSTARPMTRRKRKRISGARTACAGRSSSGPRKK